MATYEEYARISAHVYGGSSRPPLPAGWNPVLRSNGQPLEISGSSGYYGAVFKNSSTGEFVLASRGTEIVDPGDRRAVWELAASSVPRAQLDDAQILVATAIEAGVPRDQLTYTGHSLGGSLAQLLSTADMRPAVTFNAAPVKAMLPELSRDPNGQYPIVDVVDPSDLIPHSDAHLGTRVELARPLFPLPVEVALMGGASPFGMLYGAFRLQRAHSIDSVVTKLGTARSLIPCPIVLDLDADGVETTSVQGATFFDHNGDGFAERTGWAGADDGLLVRDRDGNGRIESGRELFGNHTLRPNGSEAAHGFQALSDLDANADGKVDASDPLFGQLRIWRDLNRNGTSEPTELQTLAGLGIRAVATSYVESGAIDPQGNALRQVGSFTRADGTQGVAVDAWFASRPADTLATTWLPVSDAIRALPDAPGAGTLRDLSQSMAQDQTGTLEGLVRAFVSQTDPVQRTGMLEQILFEWTGSAALDPASRGPVMDARQLAVLEAFSGEPFVGGWGPNPAEPARPLLLEAYNEVREMVYAELMVQSHLKPFFDRIVFQWDPIAQVVRADLSEVACDIESSLAADPATGRVLASEFARAVRAFDREDAWGYAAFRDGLADLAPDLPWLMDSAGTMMLSGTVAADTLVGTSGADGMQGKSGDDTLSGGLNADAIYGDEGADTLTGDDGNDHLVGGAGNDLAYGGPGDDRLEGSPGHDVLHGEAGDDSLVGGEGDDQLFGNDGNDVLHAGPGTDTLDGGRGSDVYTFGRGSGLTTIKDNDWAFPSTDVVRMEAGIAPSDVRVSRDGSDLVLRIADSAAELRLHWWFEEGFGYEYQVQRVEFAEGSVWTIDTLKDIVTRGTEGADAIFGFGTDDLLQGHGGDDMIAGSSGHDRLEGGSGADALYGQNGDDTLVGGPGDDRLEGGLDSDTYVFGPGSGRDVVYDDDWWRPATDRVLFEAGVAPTDVVRAQDGHDLVLRIGGDELRLHHWFLEGTGHAFQVQEAHFADGTVWGVDTLRQPAAQGTPGPDVLNGSDAADTLHGLAGNDVLDGRAGDDYLDGGTGADRMTGGVGNDTYVIDNTGDRVFESAGQGTDTVRSSISHTLGSNVENLTLLGTASINGIGNSVANVLVGNNGANRLSGGAGADTMRGLAGNDTYVVERAGDVVTEIAGEGVDTVEASISYVLGENLENLVLTGTGGTAATGNGLANSLTGNAAPNYLDGRGGADVLTGGKGADIYAFGWGDGADRFRENDTTAGITDRILLDSDVRPLDVILSRSGFDLLLALRTGGDVVTIQDWYRGSAFQIETIQAGDGRRLASSQVDQLIQAMAMATSLPGAVPMSWANAITERPAEVEAVLAAYWQMPAPGSA